MKMNTIWLERVFLTELNELSHFSISMYMFFPYMFIDKHLSPRRSWILIEIFCQIIKNEAVIKFHENPIKRSVVTGKRNFEPIGWNTLYLENE